VTFVPAAAVSLPPDRVSVAFGIGRPVGDAVVRNRLRRRCRPVIEAATAAGRLPGGAYLVSLAPDAAAVEPASLRCHVERALSEVTA
jgi:ribonuclease P protein component